MKKFAVIGDPVEQSLSPILHKEIYRQLGANASYEKVHVMEETLSLFMDSNLFDGFNVTIPHKESIIPYLDSLDEAAKLIGAVNCIVGNIGYNTDWVGFLDSMVLNQVDLDEKYCLIIGAGGAARSVAYALIQANVKSIVFQNRTKSREAELTTWVNKLYPKNRPGRNPDIIINCTPVGMWPKIQAIPFNIHQINQIGVLVDTIYNPIDTEWLQKGKKAGAKIVKGIDMFIAQGLASANIWFGEEVSKKIDLEIIRKVLESKLC